MTAIDLNFWDDYNYNFLKWKSNKIEQWNGPDCEENFKKVKADPKIITYGESDFFYKRNSYGFRSENFNNEDEVKVLYAGCSLTEGVGLPLEHTWSHFVNALIGRDLGKKLSTYNIGHGGFSIDAIVRYTYLTIKNGIFKPDIVLLLLPSISRNEIVYKDEYNQMQTYHFISTFNALKDPQVRVIYDNQMRAFLATHRLHETFRNLLFLKEFLDNRGIPFFFQTWDNTKHVFGNHAFLGFADALFIASPSDLKPHLIPVEMPFDNSENKYQEPFKQNIGRDGMHPGPNSHWNYANDFYAELKKKDEFKKVFERWDK